MDMHRQTRIIGVLLLCLAGAAVQAGTALFESEIVVSDQSPQVRNAALDGALREILVRVTGQPDVLNSEAARSLLASSQQLVQQYRYFTESGKEPPLLKLWVRFDGAAIRQALQQQGVAYWGGERPDTLVWLAVEDRGNRYVVAPGEGGDVYREVEAAGRSRGVPLIFPLMDLEDQTRVRFADIWGGYTATVISASQRYSPPAILIGRLNRTASGGWAARWQLEMGGRRHAWSDTHPELAALAGQGINELAGLQAAQLAVTTPDAAGSDIVITVDGINDLAAYARTGNYLAALSAVRSVQLDEASGAAIHYRLQLNGNLQDLERTVAVGSMLEPVRDGMAGHFRLRQ